MISFTPPFSRVGHLVFMLTMICLTRSVGSTSFIPAPSDAPTSHNFNNPSINQPVSSQTASLIGNTQIFVVTNVNDQGAGSFREAITSANAQPGTDTITFDIPEPGVKVITLLTPLPEITDPVVISADAQPGYVGAPLIELDGTNAGSAASGLVIAAGPTTIRGFAIGGFQTAGILLRSCNNNLIEGNYVGVDATGTLARSNNIGIELANSSGNLIGGTVAAMRNVISGNLSYGVKGDGNSTSNMVQGNFIGTNAAGTGAILSINNQSTGVLLGGSNNLIGGASPGAGNLISGNQFGISSGNTIQGNLIGTDVTGTSKVPNQIGIRALGGTHTLIGGLTPEARNVISGNLLYAVIFSGNGSKLQGNFIGTDITGTLALGNGQGVFSGNQALIGGTVPEARNVIAGNGGFGNIVLDLGPNSGAIVQGNYLGTDVTGTRALGGIGISIFSDNNSISQNVISGNLIGVQLGYPILGLPPGNGNLIDGNIIGLNAQGTGPLPNQTLGISLQAGSSNNSITANKIAFNGDRGITMYGGTRNSIRGNSIFSNGGIGIDVGSNGVTLNDPGDTDVGENNLQNFPVITSVLSVGNNTTIQGSLNSIPNTTFQIDLFSNVALDPSGYGEGALFLGTTTVNTDGNGDAAINVTFPVSLGTGRVVTATATDPNGNSSEFSAGDVSGATGNVQFSVDSIRLIEDLGVANITVLRKGGSLGNLTVDYATVAGTATAGQDYTATSGTLTFNGGETSKSFQIPIINDEVTEADETFTVALSNTPSLENLGTPSTFVITIQDRSTVPTILQNDPSIGEGNTGDTREMFFTFKLTAATGRSVSAEYATSNLNGTGGSSCSNPGTDYETTSGTISFPPGDTSTVTIAVKICGDTIAEGPEDFRVNLSNLSNATSDLNHGIGRILDDDPLELILEESGPTVNQAAALDALLFLRDPFPVVGIPEWFTSGPDRNTRVMFFVRNLEMNPDSPSTIHVELGTASEFFTVPAEDVRFVRDVEVSQVVIRLPDNLTPGAICTVNVRVEFQVTHLSLRSNSATIRIAP